MIYLLDQIKTLKIPYTLHTYAFIFCTFTISPLPYFGSVFSKTYTIYKIFSQINVLSNIIA